MTTKDKPSYEELAQQVNELKTELKAIKGKGETPLPPFESTHIIDHFNATSVKNENGVYVFINKPFTDKFLLTENDILGKTDYDLLSKEEADLYRKEDLLILETGESIERENELFWGGKKHFFILQKFLIPGTEGSARFVGVIGTDITERKQAEALLKENEMRLRLSMNTAKAGSWIWNIETDEVVWDDRMQEIFGFEPGTYDGTYESWKNAVHPDDVENADMQTKAALKNGSDYDLQYRLNIESDKGYFRTVRAQAIVISNKQAERIRMAGLCVDITERKQREEERKKLESQLRQAVKLEALGTLAGGIAHDFNNILSAILGHGQMALEELSTESHIYEDIKQIMLSGDRAAELIKQILLFSRQEDEYFHTLPIEQTIHEVVGMFSSTLPATIKFSNSISSDCGSILADPTQIHQVVMNLCTNARQALQDDYGSISIALSEVSPPPSFFTQQAIKQTSQKYACIEIRDSGCGIPPEIQSKVFDPFFTTKAQEKGTGLGLAVADGIVRKHHGLISCESSSKTGTVFQVYLPIVESNNSAELPTNNSEQQGYERILLVDDEAPLIDLHKRFLEKRGYQVTCFSDSLEALNFFQNNCDSYDMIVSDMTMPNLTGLDLIKEILRVRPEIKSILCTGFSKSVNEDTAQSFGVNVYLEKPFIPRKLAQTIRKVFDHG